jgi:hypothetical protein
MKLYLDDERPAPEGWVLVKTSREAIEVLCTGTVEELSLDHDLGDGNGSGYDVLTWLEEQVYFGRMSCPKSIHIHSANPVGCQRMKQVISSLLSIKDRWFR